MTRNLVNKNGSLFLDNEFQERFVIEKNQSDDFVEAINAAKDQRTILGEEEGHPRSKEPVLKCGEIEIVPTSPFRDAIFEVYNSRNDSFMYFRNSQHVKGVSEQYQKYTSSDYTPQVEEVM